MHWTTYFAQPSRMQLYAISAALQQAMPRRRGRLVGGIYLFSVFLCTTAEEQKLSCCFYIHITKL